MCKKIVFILALFLALAGNSAFAQTNDLIRSYPEAEGISSKYVKAFFDSLMTSKTTQIHSCIILRHGRVVGEMYPSPWTKDYCHTMYSASKTFTAVAVGMAIKDSLISLNDPIEKYLYGIFPTSASDTLKAITIRSLLTMQSGLPVDTHMREVQENWLWFYLHQTPKAAPDSLFAYDSIATYFLSAIVQTVTGEKLFDYLKKRLFDPMHIKQVAWEESPEGITCGGWGLYLQPESLAKFGQLLLRGGMWNGISLVPAYWVKEMMSPQSVTGKYGYQMWLCDYAGWAQANGAYGQHLYVIPEKDLVVSITQCSNGATHEQKWIHDILVKKFDKIPQKSPKSTFYTQLINTRYGLPPIRGKAKSMHYVHNINVSLAKNILGWEKVVIQNRINNEVSLKITDENGKTYTIDCDYGKWDKSTISGWPYCPRKFLGNFSNLPSTWHVAASYAWSSDNTINIRLHWIDWITSADISFKINGAKVNFVVRPQDTGKGIMTQGWVL